MFWSNFVPFPPTSSLHPTNRSVPQSSLNLRALFANMVFNEKQFSNMDEQPPADSFMLLRLSAVKPEISRVVSEEQSLNIPIVLNAFAVLNPETSRDVNEEQPLNILNIYVALDVSNPDTSIVFRDEQPSNIL